MPPSSATTHSNIPLLAAVSLLAIGWQLPYGPQVLYPFTLFATYAHEMGHGLTALAVGGEFRQLVINADGSGLALWQGQLGAVARAAVAAGGLLGPSAVGALLIAFATPRNARVLLLLLAAGMAASVLLWVRNPFGIAFVLGFGLFFALAAIWFGETLAAFVLCLSAAVLNLAWFSDLSYMFSDIAMVAGQARPSDTALIARQLYLPYWFWGAVIAALSLILLALGWWRVSRR